ncbi:unnamed protein product [Strongylus vulgaris]|uniref:Uncharacterized protein n=1 Tax=Strongylus vulgaris TaxID=40348 RepID=A0A3P7JQ95_STRVU|nr:unnamed protein product [Strongylus vulgaris]
MQALILLIFAVSCRANLLEDTVVEAIKTAQQNLEERDKIVATSDGEFLLDKVLIRKMDHASRTMSHT